MPDEMYISIGEKTWDASVVSGDTKYIRADLMQTQFDLSRQLGEVVQMEAKSDFLEMFEKSITIIDLLKQALDALVALDYLYNHMRPDSKELYEKSIDAINKVLGDENGV